MQKSNMIKKYWNLLIIIFLFYVNSSFSMEMKLNGDTLILSNTQMTLDDYVKYKELVKGKIFSNVLLVNQPGGAIDTAIGIAEDLIKREITTITAGRCLSACTILFLSGKERKFSSKYPISNSKLGFHSSYNIIGLDQNSSYWSKLYNFYKSRLGENFDGTLINKAISELSNANGFLYIYHPFFKINAQFCYGTIEKPCQEIIGKNILSMNLVTTQELSEIDIPAYLLPKTNILGLDLDNLDKLSNPNIKQMICNEFLQDCFKNIEKYESFKNERAVAVSPTTKKYGYSYGYEDLRSAARRALYECTIVSNSICYLSVLNDRIVNDLYKFSEDKNRNSIDILTKFSQSGASEDPKIKYELPMKKLRIGSYHYPTPEKIDNVNEIFSEQIIQFLTRKENIVLIDVICGDFTIPTANCIYGGGLASSDLGVDSQIEKNLLLILNQITQNKNLPILFFCEDDHCWLSANSAFRAAKQGYKVYWYRGGMKLWKSKGLPVVPNTPIGAVMANAG